jgi:hypothetical protein
MPSFSVLPGCEGFLFSPSTPRWSLNQNPFRAYMRGTELKDQPMLTVRLMALTFVSAVASFTTHAQFADSVLGYSQGSGIISGYGNPNSALGAPTTFIGYQNADPFNPPYQASHIVGVGTGGFLTLHLALPILNDPHAYGLDFIVFGHSGFNITNGDYSGGGITDGSFFTGGTSTSRVSVSADGVTFYTLNPLLAPQADGRFPTDANGNPLVPVNPALTQGDFGGKNLPGIRALYSGSGGGMGFDLSMAQDGSGNSVALPLANYVRIDVLSDVAYIDAVSVVPEPSGGALMMLAGAVGMWGAWRRGRHRHGETSNSTKLQTSGKHQASN